MNPNGRKRLAVVLRGLAWGVAIAAALYTIALWLLLRPLASSVADGWIDAVDNEPAGAAEEPAAPSAAATATADERIRRAFAKLSARVSPDDVRRNVAEEDWDVWNETAWPAVHALDDFYRETASVPGVRGFDPSNAVLAMADGNVWTNGLDFALGGVRLDPTELGYFIWVNQAAQKYAHTEEGFPELPCRFNTTDDPFFPAIHGWRMLVRSGWLLDWDDRRLVVRIAAPPPLPDDDADSEAAPDFAAFLACQHHFRDDPARIRPDPFLRPVSRTEQALLVQSWKSIRQAGLAVEKTSDGGWRLVGDSDAVLPPVSVLAAAMWPDRLVHPSGKEPGIRRAQALCVLSLLRPAQLSAILAGPPDDPRRGFVLRALGLAHAFGCAPEWDGKDWADAADRFALDDDARIEPARALLLRSELFAPYRDEIERAGAEFPFRFRPEPPKPPSVDISDIGADPSSAQLLFDGDAALAPEERRRVEIRPPVVRRKASAESSSFAAGPAPDLAAAFERLAARVSPDDVRRNIAEADDEVWLETAWSALNALEDFSKETGCQPGRGEYHPETAVFAMADGAIWTNGLDYALNGTPREALNLRWFVLLNQLVQKVGHFDGETLDVRLRGEGSHFDEPLVATIWHGLAKAGWWLDWDHRRLVLRISRPAGTPEEEDASAADFAAFLACAHFFHDDPARIPGESEVAERLANLLASSWKRLRANGWTVKPAGFENWRRVPDSDAPPPAIVLKAAMWDDLRCYPWDEEPAIRRSEALEFLSFLRPAQLSALLAGPRDDPRRGFVLRALGLAHAFGCAPEWDGKEWTDAADRFALDDDARREPARALLFQNALFAPYRDEIEAAAAPDR